MVVDRDDWTGRWVAQKVRGHTEVSEVEVVAPTTIRITRQNHPDVIVRTTSEPKVTGAVAETMLRATPPADFLVVVPTASRITGQALDSARNAGVPIGRMGDIMSALGLEDVRRYVNKEFVFVERGLRQHSRVSGFERIDERRYRISRPESLDDIFVVFVNEYEVTADVLRTARDRFGSFEWVVLTNPNAKVTESASEAATQLGLNIHRWGAFLSALNR